MLKALVIEDDDVLRESLVCVLTLWGLDAVGAARGGEGMELAASHEPDIAVLDLGLPDAGGEQVARSLKSRGPITLIAISGQHERLRRLPAGLFDHALAKPFPLLSLRAAVSGVLARRESRSERLVPLMAPA